MYATDVFLRCSAQIYSLDTAIYKRKPLPCEFGRVSVITEIMENGVMRAYCNNLLLYNNGTRSKEVRLLKKQRDMYVDTAIEWDSQCSVTDRGGNKNGRKV